MGSTAIPGGSAISSNVLPLTKAANGSNSAISLTQTFDRILFCVCNSLYFGVQKAKHGDRGTIVFTATLTELRRFDDKKQKISSCFWKTVQLVVVTLTHVLQLGLTSAFMTPVYNGTEGLQVANVLRCAVAKCVRQGHLRCKWTKRNSGGFECFNDWGGQGFHGSVPGEVPKTIPSGDRTT